MSGRGRAPPRRAGARLRIGRARSALPRRGVLAAGSALRRM